MLDLVSPSTGSSKITFSDDNNAAGSITYDHPHNKMKFMIGTTLSFWVSPNAHLRLFEALEDATGQAGVADQFFHPQAVRLLGYLRVVLQQVL